MFAIVCTSIVVDCWLFISCFGSIHNSVIIDVIGMGPFNIIVITVERELVTLFDIIDVIDKPQMLLVDNTVIGLVTDT